MASTALVREVPFTEAKNKFSALTADANRSGSPFVILKNNSPWVEVRPLAVRQGPSSDGIVIKPVRHEVAVADLDKLFLEYDGSYRPSEDGFAAPFGSEEV